MRKKYLLIVFVMLIPFIAIALQTGDINGDGKVSITDYNLIRRHIVGTNKLTGDKLTRADVNNDGKVSIADFNSIRRIIVNGSTTEKTSNKFQIPLRQVDGSLLSGGDPFVTFHNGYYYFVQTSGKKITINKTKNLHEIGKPEVSKIIWQNDKKNVLWAPEIHYINGKWYIYYTDIDPSVKAETQKRVYVLRSKTSDPLGEYESKGKIKFSKEDYYGIDGTVFEWKNELYYVFGGSPTLEKTALYIYIAHMKNPYTVDSNRVLIAKPTYDWEKKSGIVNEGPQVLIKNNTLHIIYSGNNASSEYYLLGMLTYKGSGSLLSQSSWTKASKPVFQSGNGVYGPGHASFTKSPDGKEDWIVYHAYPDNKKETTSNYKRTIRIQKFTWDGNTPNFGKPKKADTWLNVPSGSK